MNGLLVKLIERLIDCTVINQPDEWQFSEVSRERSMLRLTRFSALHSVCNNATTFSRPYMLMTLRNKHYRRVGDTYTNPDRCSGILQKRQMVLELCTWFQLLTDLLQIDGSQVDTWYGHNFQTEFHLWRLPHLFDRYSRYSVGTDTLHTSNKHVK
jgi:hypothetical protein